MIKKHNKRPPNAEQLSQLPQLFTAASALARKSG
jgi:hypothetical protein